MQLHPLQQQAVDLCLDTTKRIVAVTGPAGSGKTTIIKQVVAALADQGKVIGVCAPTGKAARRITQATGVDAVTIHRLLEYPKPGDRDPDTGKVLNPGQPKRCTYYPLHHDVIIADEYAMVNYELDRNLIDALKRGARLLVFGDVFQLPPIESSQALAQEKSPFEKHLARENAKVTLEHVFRQAEDGGILGAANNIRLGRMPAKHDDFQYAFTNDQPAYLLKYLSNCMDAGVDFSTLDNQIICAEEKSWVGTGPLNAKLQYFFRGNQEDTLQLPRHSWDKNTVVIGVGDKVVCTENTYDMRDYHARYEEFNDRDTGIESTFIPAPAHQMMLNGEVGIVEEIFADGSIYTNVGDRVVHMPAQFNEYDYYKDNFFPKDPRRSLDLAYALTTHKSQGSEFGRVIYIVSGSKPFMLNRRNFYTAVTRAKSHVMVICDQSSLQYSLRPFVPPKPYTSKKSIAS